MSKLTKSYIDSLPIPDKKPDGKAVQAIYRDSALSGFGLLIGSGGTKSFFVERRINGRVKRVSIGRYGHLTPVQARNKAQELLGQIALGKDPRAEKKALNAKNITLETAFEDYLSTRKGMKDGTIKNYRKCMDGCLSDWLPKRLVDISKDMVEAKHIALGQNAPARANNTMRVLRAVYNHALAKYEDSDGKALFSINPVDRLSKNRAWYPTERRQSLLKPHELSTFFNATGELSNEVSRDFLRFLLFTGLRKMEAATLTWSDISFEEKSFTIKDTKNGKAHTLPLTTYLTDLLLQRQQQSASLWVFPSPVDSGHIKEPRGAIKHVASSLGRPFMIHDLRRTFITIAESLDIPAYALKQLLNHHSRNDVTAGYIISSTDRLRTPMDLISEYLLFHENGGAPTWVQT